MGDGARFSASAAGHVANPPAADGGKSDVHVNKLTDLFLNLQNLSGLYNRWVNHPCADPAKVGEWRAQPALAAEDRKNADQLKGVDYGLIKEMQGRLSGTGAASSELDKLSSRMGSDLDSAWNSGTSAKAVEKFTDLSKASSSSSSICNELATALGGFHQSATNAGKSISDLWDRVCRKGSGLIDQQGWLGNAEGDSKRHDRSRMVDKLDEATRCGVAEKDHLITDDSYNFENGKNLEHIKKAQDIEKKYASNGDLTFRLYNNDVIVLAATPQRLRSPAFCNLDEHGDGETYSDQICRQMDKLCNEYSAAIKDLRDTVKAAVESVDKSLSTLNSTVSQSSGDLDPFGKLVAPGDAPPAAPPRQETPSPGRHSPPPRSGGPSATAPAQASPSPSSQPTQSPNAQPPDVPQPSPAPTAPSLATPAAGHDVPQHGGLPPQATPAAQDHQETVKVKGANGDTIEMSSPDGRGHMKLSVDNGSGKPKSYDVDFGDGMGVSDQDAGQSPGKHAMDQTGATSQSGGQHAVGGQGLGQPGADGGAGNSGAHVSPVQDPRGGLDGAAGQPGAGGAPQHVQADHSGHAVIHDGDNTITIDKGAGDSGEVKVTVDDGSGNPTSYTMDTGAATGTGSSDQPSAPATDQPGAPATGVPVTDQPSAPATGAPAHMAPMAQHGNADLGVPQQAHSGADLGAQHSGAVSQPQQGNVGGGNFDAAAATTGGAAGGMDSAGDTPSVNHTATTSTANVQAGVASVAGDAGAGADASGASAFTGAGGDSGAGVGAGVAGGPAQPGAVSGADPTMGASGQHDMGQHGGAPGVADAGAAHSPAGAGDPGVAGPAGGTDHGGGAGAAGGAMPMMGGMGGAGGGGGDSERGASAWRTQGDLFSDVGDAAIDQIEDLLDGHERR